VQSNTNTSNQDDASNQAKQAVILAAGEGIRLRPLTDDKPKALVEVDGRPLIEHSFDFLLQNADIQSFIVVTGYKGEQIQEKYEKFYRDTPVVCVNQPEQHGLAHALFQSKLFIDDDFLVCLGDLVFSPDTSLDGLLDASEEGDGALLTERVPTDEASRYGVVDVDSEGRITNLIEKPENPPTNQIITGVTRRYTTRGPASTTTPRRTPRHWRRRRDGVRGSWTRRRSSRPPTATTRGSHRPFPLLTSERSSYAENYTQTRARCAQTHYPSDAPKSTTCYARAR